MTSRREDATTTSSTPTRLVAPILLMIVIGALGIYGISMSSFPALLGSVVIGAVAVFMVPRNALPASALWLLVLLPVGYMHVPVLGGRYFSPAVVVIAVWILRLALAERMTLLLQTPIRGWLIATPCLMLLIASALQSERSDISFAWIVVLIICVVAPALIGQISRDDIWPTVRRSLAGIGLFLGVLASADFLLGFNPWTSWYEHVRIWESGFRTSTSLGHPLTTSLVATVALAACVFPAGKARQWPYWICGAGASVALILTVSRASVIAVGVSAIIGILSAHPRMAKSATLGRGRLMLMLTVAALFAALALSPLLKNRNASKEGISSVTYRSQLLDAAKGLIGERPMLGFGPGTSRLAYGHLSLENSAVQLMVSNGLPVFLFTLAAFCLIVTVAMRRSRAGVAAGIVAFWVSASGFNVIDNVPAFLALIAPLIVCAVMPGPSRLEEVESTPEVLDRTDGHPGSDRLTKAG